MAKVHAQRMMAELDGEFVVFLIGMRIDQPRKVHNWRPVFTAMPRALKELDQTSDSGSLGQAVVHVFRPALMLFGSSVMVTPRHFPSRPAMGKRERHRLALLVKSTMYHSDMVANSHLRRGLGDPEFGARAGRTAPPASGHRGRD